MNREDFLHFIWEHGLYRREGMRTTCGNTLEVIRPGGRNIHAGPDYINACIKVGRLVWCGNVEIHSRSSDWENHGHHLNPGYNNVILHVVNQYEGEIKNSGGTHVFTCVLSYPGQLLSRYRQLISNPQWLPCQNHIGKVPAHIKHNWMHILSVNRLKEKTRLNMRILLDLRLSREETLFRAMASAYGLPINNLPFEIVASAIPLHLLLEIRDNVTELEGILFGQSGLISRETCRGPYVCSLLESYQRYSKYLPHHPVSSHLWKFLRLRPASFPTLRMAQFASLLQQHLPLARTLLRASSLVELEQLLRVKASPYWDTHYLFEKQSPPLPKYLGNESVRIQIINAYVPFLRALGRAEKQHSYSNRATEILLELEAESNYIVKKWINFGWRPRNAFESQAMIQLHNAYCKQRRCLECMFGAYFLETTVDEELQS
jgi:hypothetical protein